MLAFRVATRTMTRFALTAGAGCATSGAATAATSMMGAISRCMASPLYFSTYFPLSTLRFLLSPESRYRFDPSVRVEREDVRAARTFLAVRRSRDPVGQRDTLTLSDRAVA